MSPTLMSLPHSHAPLTDHASDHKAFELGVMGHITSRKGQPLWASERVASDNVDPASASELAGLVRALARVIADNVPQDRSTPILRAWADSALRWAATCPSTHLASRSHQVKQGEGDREGDKCVPLVEFEYIRTGPLCAYTHRKQCVHVYVLKLSQYYSSQYYSSAGFRVLCTYCQAALLRD